MPPMESAVKRARAAEDLIVRATTGSRQGSTLLGRAGDIVQQPPVWAAVAGALAVAGGRGRRAALRGSVCYVVAAVIANLVVKPIVGRSRPPQAGKGRIGPVTSSFPSGHAATDLAFAIGAAQELPFLFLPLAAGTTAAHWSLVRSRGHYPTDVVVGGAIGLLVGLAVWYVWRPGGRTKEESAAPGEQLDGKVLTSS